MIRSGFLSHRLVLVVGLAALTASACSNDSKSPTTPTPTSNEVFYTAVGASDGIGYGGSSPCVPFTDCPSGTGYVQTVARRLKDSGKVVTLMNLSIPGAVLGPTIEGIGNQIGRQIPGNFLDREAPFVPRNSTLVTVFAGGNDINTVAAAVYVAGLGGNDPAAWVATQTRQFGADLKSLIGGIRNRAPNARIIVLNLPNFAGLPLAATYNATQKKGLQAISVAFSAEVNALVGSGVTVVDLMCDPRSYVAGNYSGDGFHPNDAGYAFLTELVWPVAASGAGAAPFASCPQMAMF